MSKRDIRDYDKDLVIYSKYCAICEYPDEIKDIKTWALNHNLEVVIVRTACDRQDHKRATDLWGNKNYPTFVVHDDITELKEFVKMIKNSKNKMAKIGRDKNVDLRPRTAKNAVGEDKMVHKGEKATEEASFEEGEES